MALTKTTTKDVIDAWQDIASGTIVIGAAEDISGDYSAMLYIEAASIEALEQSGMDIIVEISYGTENWIEFTTIKTANVTLVGIDLVGDYLANDTVVEIEGGDVLAVDDPGQQWLIYKGGAGGAVALSELVRTKSVTGNDVTLSSPLQQNHNDANSTAWEFAEQWTIELPFSASQVRVLYNNTDANSDMAATTRISKITDLG